ncbi:BTB/POZ domain-containing protein KCTD14 [Nerophis lumbriciformis]|uniref:BTB/POZ domain-containing protein KCTD14 n=1 Tax=Nerophis lumbriciformis TaxID=546530 RepID=UPI002AE082E6|nr:BTB/POZ domain-containing protein KCTD14 [Nerophis lumbriciformis]
MNKMELKSAEEYSESSSPHTLVVNLNVGGHRFCTALSTLTKYPESKLAGWFSAPSKLLRDSQGHIFLDRDGSHFGAVLEFLRSERVPTENVQQVHREAVHYNVTALIRRLEESPLLYGELVGRKQFLARVPHYKENIEVLTRIARAEAVASRHSSIIICVLRTEEDLGCYDNAIASLEATTRHKESVVTFGPWSAGPSPKDLLDCVKKDIENQGYTVSIQPHVKEKNFLSRSYGFFYTLTFTWW